MTLQQLKESLIFVFGSNLAGRHGAGAAKYAKDQLGAKHGVGYGPSGRTFAIPTKDAGLTAEGLKTLKNEEIFPFIVGFLAFAGGRPDSQFQLTRIGCGLAGKSDLEMVALIKQAILFIERQRAESGLPANIWIPIEWTAQFPSHSKRFEFNERTQQVDFSAKIGESWISLI